MRRRFRAWARALLTGTLLVSCGAGELRVEDAYVVPSPAGSGPAGGFLIVSNTTASARALLGADSDEAARVELHRSWIEDGVARMAPVESAEIDPGGTLRLEPGGLHLMLFALAPGDDGRVRLRLRFDDGSVLPVEAALRPVGEAGHAEHEAGHAH